MHAWITWVEGLSNWQRGHTRSSKAMIGCEVLEGRQLLSRGWGWMPSAHGGRTSHARHGRTGLLRRGRFGRDVRRGNLGLGGGMKDPIFLLTASLLNSGNGSTSPPSRSVLSSSAVQSAFQTLQTDFNNDVSVGAKPTHASVGQLQDDLKSIRKGTLTGTAATTAIQNDEAAILTSMGLSSSQVSQIQSDLQAVQTAIQSAVDHDEHRHARRPRPARRRPRPARRRRDGHHPRRTTAGTTPSRRRHWPATTTSTVDCRPRPPPSAVQTAFQTLQTDLKTDTPERGPADIRLDRPGPG